MAKTRIADVIVPEVFANYVSNRTAELSALIQSGISRVDPLLNGLVTQGGKLINMPFWQDLTGDSEVLSDATPMTPDKINAEQDVAALLIRGRAWSTNQLAGALAGSDPMAEIANKVAAWWARDEQKVLLSVLKGVFAAPTMAGHVKDAGTSAISPDLILDTKQLLGDASGILSAIFMHSAVYTALQKQQLIQYVQPADASIRIPTYLGYNVIVDDGCPVAAGKYTTYLFANGAIGRGEGAPVSLVPVDTDKDVLQSDDYLVNRRAFVIHPYGVRFKNNTVTGVTPTNTELALAANWERVYEDKQIGLAALIHTL